MSNSLKDILVLPAGTIVKLEGFPFRLEHDTKVYGKQSNLDLAREVWAEQRCLERVSTEGK